MSTGVAEVQARIAAIQSQFPAPAARPSAANAAAFATVLAGAQRDTPAPTRSTVYTPQGPTALQLQAATPTTSGSGAPLVAGSVAPSTAEKTRFSALFTAAEQRNNLPAGLLNAIAKNESNYNPNAVSPAGARGLMQIMPATARELGVNPDNPVEAIDGAARLLASNLRQFKSIDLAVAAYNAGAGAVARHGGIPPYSETRTYVQRVLTTFRGA